MVLAARSVSRLGLYVRQKKLCAAQTQLQVPIYSTHSTRVPAHQAYQTTEQRSWRRGGQTNTPDAMLPCVPEPKRRPLHCGGGWPTEGVLWVAAEIERRLVEAPWKTRRRWKSRDFLRPLVSWGPIRRHLAVLSKSEVIIKWGQTAMRECGLLCINPDQCPPYVLKPFFWLI